MNKPRHECGVGGQLRAITMLGTVDNQYRGRVVYRHSFNVRPG